MARFLLRLFVIFAGLVIYYACTTIAGRVYNIDAPLLQDEIDRVNAQYGINIDVVVLNSGDRCVNDVNPSECVLTQYVNTSDLLVVVNLESRRIETRIEESIQSIFSMQDLNNFEAAATNEFAEDRYIAGLTAYVLRVEDFIQAECVRFEVESCSESVLKNAIEASTFQQQLERTEQQNRLLQRTIILVVLLASTIWLLRWLTKRRQIRQYRQDLQTIDETLRYMLMQIDADNEIFVDTKEQLSQRIHVLQAKIEDLQTVSAHALYIRMKKERKQLFTEMMDVGSAYQNAQQNKKEAKKIEVDLENFKQINL